VSLKLSILDQSPVLSSGTPAQAIQATLDLARRAEALGYCRYWLAEHHAIAALADPCPEVLLARLGAETKRMRIGTGGVLLPYYSPLKVAEVFRMLEALYPGRVDLGIGRAPGGDARTAHAVAGGQFPSADDFPQRVWELVGHLDGTLPEDHPHKRVRVQPGGETAPQIWLLGSSDYSGLLAAQMGLRFAFAHFINAKGGDAVTRAYRERFQPSAREKSSAAIVCVFAICAVSDVEAERLAASIDLRRLHMALNLDTPVPTLEEATRHVYTEEERRYVLGQRDRAVIGGPEKCRRELGALVERYGANELMLITITGDYATRLRSYELLAQAFSLA
jgi:luciferase family oxidoreductase group 1